MFVCVECGSTFEEPKSWEEKHGLDCGPYENFSGCPYCGGAYVEAHRCDCCGGWITSDSYVKIGDERYCEDCFDIRFLGNDE